MHPIQLQLQVQMWPGGISRRTYLRDFLPHGYQLTLGDAQLTAMGIEGFDAVAVVQLKVQTVGVVLSDVVHLSVGKGRDALLPPQAAGPPTAGPPQPKSPYI